MIDPELALKIVRTSRVIAYDTETSGLNFATDFVVGYVVTDDDHSIYVPVRHEGGGNIPDPEGFEKELAAAFADRSRLGYLTVGHNLNFDLTMGSKHGVLPGAPLEDTQINEVFIDDNTVGYGLDDCCARHGVAAKKGSDLYAELAGRFGGVPDRKQMANFWRLPGDHPLVVDYATGDGTSTLALRHAQSKIIQDEGCGRSHELDCALIPYIAKMKIKGMKVDMDLASRIGTEVKAEQDKAKAVLPPGFNVRSPKECEAFFRGLGYEDGDFDRTAQGKPSFTEKWLEKRPEGEAILQVRRLEKLEDSFITPLIDTYNINGRVHANLNQSKSDEYGTNTGRLSCSDPNLQAFPKRNKQIGKVVRRLIIPDDGMILEEADFKQQEPRLFTHYSEDKYLLEGYLSDPPRDIHSTVSMLLHKDRDTAKRLGLGMLTGMQYKALAGHMGYSLAEAKRDWDAFMGALSGIADFQSTAKDVASRRGYVRTILGRKARFPDRRWAYKATSRIIQGSGAEHMKMALLRAHQFAEAEGNIDILMTIHDSNIWQRTPDANVNELVRIVENVANELGLIVPIPVDLGSGSNWAEASYGK